MLTLWAGFSGRRDEQVISLIDSEEGKTNYAIYKFGYCMCHKI